MIDVRNSAVTSQLSRVEEVEHVSGSVGIGLLLVSESVIGSFTTEEPTRIPTRRKRSGATRGR